MKGPKTRRENQKRLIEGRNSVLEALLAETAIDRIWLAGGVVKNEKIDQILRLANQRRVLVKRMARKSLNKISRTQNCQGVIAFASLLPRFSLTQLLKNEKEKSCFLFLTEVLDEQNLGAVLRTAEAAGATAVVVPKKAKGVTPVVAKTAMGAAEYIPVINENLFSALRTLSEQGIKIVGAQPDADRSLYQADLRAPIAFVVGGENKGLTAPVKKACDFLVSIPMMGKVSSLNMSVACAVLLYEKLRQETAGNNS